MAYDKVVDSAVLEAGLESIAGAIRNKGGTTGTLSFPDGMASAIAAISTGVTVQTKNGTATSNSSGVLTLNCGFKPDLVVLYFGVYESNFETFITLPIKEQKQTGKYPLGIAMGADGIIEGWVTSATSSTTKISLYLYDWSWAGSYYANQSISYRAVKYS